MNDIFIKFREVSKETLEDLTGQLIALRHFVSRLLLVILYLFLVLSPVSLFYYSGNFYYYLLYVPVYIIGVFQTNWIIYEPEEKEEK